MKINIEQEFIDKYNSNHKYNIINSIGELQKEMNKESLVLVKIEYKLVKNEIIICIPNKFLYII